MSKHRDHRVRGAREHVFALFRGAAERLVLDYHHFARTREIVDACKEIAKGSELGDEARDVAILCAWFYDACYTVGTDDHAKSVELCLQFLEAEGVRHAYHDAVVECFRGVHEEAAVPGGPDGPSVQAPTASDVLHDARLAVLARRDYVERIELLRLELERRSAKTFSDVEWTEHCIAFVGAHPYRTSFAQIAYGGGRAANLARLQKLLRKQVRVFESERVKDEGSVAKRVSKSADALHYHFTRIHMGLIALADHRTSTMVHVNAIMLSIVVALLARRIQTDRDLLAPTILMLVVNIAVVFISIGSMRAGKRRLPEEEARMLDRNIISPLNENFVSLDDYTAQMAQMVEDPALFQRKVIEHLYYGREMLRERAKTLRLTYTVFIYGITLSVVAFVVVLAMR